MSKKKVYAKLEKLMEILASSDTKSDNIENESIQNFSQSPLQSTVIDNHAESGKTNNRSIQHFMFSTKSEALKLCFLLINCPKKFNFYHEKIVETLVPFNNVVDDDGDEDTNNNQSNNQDINFLLIASWCNKNNKLEVDFYVSNIEKLMLTKDVWRIHMTKSVISLLESLEVSYNWKNIDFNYVCLKCNELFETSSKADLHISGKHNTSTDLMVNLDTNKYIVMHEVTKGTFKSLKFTRFELGGYYEEVDKSGLPFWATSSVVCTICDVVFGSVNELDEHNRVIHTINNQINFGSNSNPKSTINNLLTSKLSGNNNNSNSNSCANSNNSQISRHQAKEYRCTICNYKTVTKGNLHIHFQSEKHRNNQREHDQNEQRNTMPPFTTATTNPHHPHHALSHHHPLHHTNPQQHQSQPPAQHKTINSDNNRTQAPVPQPPQPPSSLNTHLLSMNPFNFMDNLLNVQKQHQDTTSTLNLASRSILTSPNFLQSLPPIFECDICHNFIHSDIEVMLEHADRPRPLPSNAEVSKIVRVQSSSSSSTSLDIATTLASSSSSSSSANIINGTVNPSNASELEHICLLDGYKTRIKANFLLHFKTEKHQQKLQLLAHAREGGLDNANKLIVQMVNEPISLVSIRCNLCNATFSTPHKLRLHVDTHDHQMNQKIASSFQMWQRSVDNNQSLNNHLDVNINNFTFECKPCGLIFKRYIEILDHFHTQRNSLHMNYFKKEMNLAALIKIHCPNSIDSDNSIASDKINSAETDTGAIKCNLCNDVLSRINLRKHLKEIHKINDNCLSRMVSIAEESNTCNQSNIDTELSSTNPKEDDQNSDFEGVKLKISNRPTSWADCILIGDMASSDPMIRCQQCGKYLSTVPLLEEHLLQEKHSNLNENGGVLCYKKGCNQYFNSYDLMLDHFYEIHAFQIHEYKSLNPFKYICKICHLFAFSSITKCTNHTNQHHQATDNTFVCVVCRNEFDNNTKLRLHIEEEHLINSDISANDETDSKDRNGEMTLDVCKLDDDSKSETNDPLGDLNDLSASHLITKSEEEEVSSINASEPTNLYGNKSAHTSPPFHTPPILSSAITDLLQSVGSENIKLIIETMINSRNKQSANDFANFSTLNPTDSLLNNNIMWLQWAESLITNANIHDSLKERCRNCNYLFSNQNILEKHKKLCGPTTNLSSQLEFDNLITLCREQLTKTLINSNSSITMPHSLFGEPNSPIFPLASNLRPPPPPASNLLPPMGLFSLLNQYNRFPFNNPTSLSNTPNYFLPPPLGTFSSLRLRNFPPTNSSQNLYFPSSVKPNTSTSPLNPLNFPTNLPDITKLPRDKPNSSTATTTNTSSSSNLANHQDNPPQQPQPKLETNRKRTQIKNYQYDILRSYFNINNPPNDEIISEIIIKTGLDRKTVKHWFRNTLFKERQKCKDSPYNFNIPPEISLNLEEYEKTGKIEIKSPNSSNNTSNFSADKVQKRNFGSSKLESTINNDMSPSKMPKNQLCDIKLEHKTVPVNKVADKELEMTEEKDSNNNTEITLVNLSKIKTEKDISSHTNGEPQTTSSQFNTLEYNSNSESVVTNDENDEEEKQSEKIVDLPLDLSTPAIPTMNHFSNASNCSNHNNGNNANLSGRDSFNLDPISPFESEHDFSDINCGTNSLSGERRHRTTLTAMQIHAMKSIFIHCRSPSHSELGALGNILSLDMRVVQVWFQNQRAKLKKQERDIYCRDKQTAIFPEAISSIIETCDSPNNTSHSESDTCKSALIDNESSNLATNPSNTKTHCLVCNQIIHPTISKQTHLFSIVHLTNLMRYLVTKTNDFKVNWKQSSNSTPSSSTHSLVNSTTNNATTNSSNTNTNPAMCLTSKINA